ncbi:MAG: RibD family protein [Bacillota bacterium]
MLPRVIVFNAVSVDGRIDWFTPDIGRFYELASRWREDATLAGSGTLLSAVQEAPEEKEGAFEPQEDPGDRRPLLVVPDSRGRVKNWDYWRKQPYWRSVVVLCSRSTPASYLDYLRRRRIEHVITGDDQADLRAALAELRARYGVETVRVDSGGTLNGVMLRAGLVDEVSVLIHPSLVGGMTPRSMFRAPDLNSPEGVLQLRLTGVEEMPGGVVWLRYNVTR